VAIDLRIERTICPAKSSFSVILSPVAENPGAAIVRLDEAASTRQPLSCWPARSLPECHVDEHSTLFQRVHALAEKPREYIFLQARGPVGNQLEHLAVEEVDAPFTRPGRSLRPFPESRSPALGRPLRPSRSDWHRRPNHGHRGQPVVFRWNRANRRKSISRNESPFMTRKSAASFRWLWASLMAPPCQRAHLFRVLDFDVQAPAIPKLAFNLVGKVAVHMTTRPIPCAPSCRTRISRNDWLPTEASGLGVDGTTERRRVPIPPTSRSAGVSARWP